MSESFQRIRSTLSGRFTGIGSLPHVSLDAALEHVFRYEIPFLPQLPQFSSKEYMIAQALEGLSGFAAGKEGDLHFDAHVWKTACGSAKQQKLTWDSYSAWSPFLWECENRGVRFAKVQLCGPFTVQTTFFREKSVRLLNSQDQGLLGRQIVELLLLRAQALCAELRARGVQPILFWDEPALVAWSSVNPLHRVWINELEVLLRTLKKEGVWVGIHCCGNTEWGTLLAMPWDIVSFDAELSLEAINQALPPDFHTRTLIAPGIVQSSSPDQVTWKSEFGLFTSNCGLGLQTITVAETVLETLRSWASAHPRSTPA